MLRTPLTRTLSLGAPSRVFAVVRTSASAATPAKVPEKIEVFVDDQSVFVDPGTTVLQVNLNEISDHIQCVIPNIKFKNKKTF